jgi:hypothetical protein
MTRPQTPPDDSQRSFLVERYVSPETAIELAASTARVARLCVDADPTGRGVRYLYSAYLPTEDTCFCLFRARSAEAVRAVNDQGHFAFDRLVDAVLMLGVESDLPPTRESS